MEQLVIGLLFDPGMSQVVLVRKGRPAWQSGKLNGVGGHVETGESPLEAQQREFREEAGLDIADWSYLTCREYPNVLLSVYYALSPDVDKARQTDYEQIELWSLDALLSSPGDLLPDVVGYIHLALMAEGIKKMKRAIRFVVDSNDQHLGDSFRHQLREVMRTFYEAGLPAHTLYQVLEDLRMYYSECESVKETMQRGCTFSWYDRQGVKQGEINDPRKVVDLRRGGNRVTYLGQHHDPTTEYNWP